MTRKQLLLILSILGNLSLFAGWKMGTGGILQVKNELGSNIVITRTEDNASWTISANSSREIAAWVPWCPKQMVITIEGHNKHIIAFGEKNAQWVRDCRKSNQLFHEKVKDLLYKGIYNLKVTGTEERPQFEFYSSNWEEQKK